MFTPTATLPHTSSPPHHLNILPPHPLHPQGNGATLWDCALVLTRALAEHYPSMEGMVVLELGAGLGLVGMACAAALGATVVSTEREIAVPLLRRNVEHNAAALQRRGCVEVAPLSWGAAPTGALIAERPAGFDLIVGSDLVFPSNSDAYILLVDTLEVLLRSHAGRFSRGGGAEPPAGPIAGAAEHLEMWLAHEPRRPNVEATFWSMLESRGIAVSSSVLHSNVTSYRPRQSPWPWPGRLVQPSSLFQPLTPSTPPPSNSSP